MFSAETRGLSNKASRRATFPASLYASCKNALDPSFVTALSTVVSASMTNGGRIHNEALFDELRKPEAERDQAVLQRLMDEDDYTTQKAE